MIKALFISESQVKASSVINENVDASVITPIIRKVQELRIHPYLGTALYNDLQDKIIADPTLSGEPEYKTLLTDYIQPCMLQYIICDATPEMLFKYMNLGVSKKSGSNTKSLEYDEALKMIERYMSDAEQYADKLVRYLIAKASSGALPLYYATGNDITYIYPKRNVYTSPIYLDEPNKNPWGLEKMQGGPTFPDDCY
jgi:hypothetical protein